MSFINWKLTNEGTKVPVNKQGRKVNAHDPQFHMSTYAEAAQYGQPAFVVIEGSGFFFLDIDKCYDPVSGWSSVAVDLCNRFTGCFIEVSQSGKGLHVIGRGYVPETIACKFKKWGIELYRRARFCALTMTSAAGDFNYDAQQTLNDMIRDYELATAGASATVTEELRDTPVPEYTGLWTAEELPYIIMQKEGRNHNKAFGMQASFKDLWTANAAVLGSFYPPFKEGQDFDHSAAEMAMCSTLCFWTGNNHAMVDEIFRESGLMRDKWNREGYRVGTLKRCTSSKVYSHVRKTSEDSTGELEEIGIPFLPIDEMVNKFQNCAYITSINRVYDGNSGLLLDQARFNAVFGGYIYALDKTNRATSSTAWNVITKCQVPVINKVNYLCFKPLITPGVTPDGFYNAYVPDSQPRQKGDATPFLHHLRVLLPNPIDQKIILNYMAALVQYKGVKFQFSPVIQGVEGNGKSLLNVIISKCIGSRYGATISGENFNSKFNVFMKDKIFIGVEEFASSDKFNVLERIKPIITNETIWIELKGIDGFNYDNYANFMLNTNHKDAVYKSVNDRRWCILYTAQQEKEDLEPKSYYVNLWNWFKKSGGFAIVHEYLATFPIDDEYNPATSCIDAPRSSVHDEVIYNSLTNNQLKITEAVDDEVIGFRGGIISSQRAKDLLNVSGKKAGNILKAIGYRKGPRMTKCIFAESGVKPYLWIKKNNNDNHDVVVDNYLSLNYGPDR